MKKEYRRMDLTERNGSGYGGNGDDLTGLTKND